GRRHRLRRGRHQARPARFRGSAHRDPARRRARRDALAPRLTPQGSLAMGRPSGIRRGPRDRRLLEAPQSALTPSRRGLRRGGIAVSTRGKVIRRGWDWLGLTPLAADRVTGLIEAPELAGALTLNKSDFLRTGPQGLAYLGYRKAIQQVVAAQLAEWGEGREAE